MANVIVEKQSLIDATDAVREKAGTVDLIKPEDLGQAILDIPAGLPEVSSISITNKSAFAEGIDIPAGAYTEVALSVSVLPSTAPQLYMVVSSSPEAIKPVYNNGTYSLRFIKAGTATITVSDYSGQVSDTMTVQGKSTPTAFSFSRKLPVFCEVGSTYQLEVTATPLSAVGNSVTYTSSDTSVGTVDANGLVTFLATGALTITATVDDYPTFTDTTASAVIVDAEDPDFDLLSQMIQDGTAEQSFAIDSTFNQNYSEDGGTTVYTMPIRVMGFRDVELEGGVTKKGMEVMPDYTSIATVRYSAPITVVSLTALSGETVAQEGYYYYDSSNNPLNYVAGDPLDFNTYPTIKKTDRNAKSASALSSLIAYGDRRWEFSNARTYLKNTYIGFFGSAFTSHIAEGKVITYDDTSVWEGAQRITYDKFFLPSATELWAGNVGTADQRDYEGSPVEWFKSNIGGTSPNSGATTYRVRQAVNAQTGSAVVWWTRSVGSSYAASEWYVDAGGSVSYSSASYDYRLSPLAILI